MSDLWGSYYYQLEKITEGNTSVEDFDYAVNLSLKYKYIFVETPKVACSTIKTTLQRLELRDSSFKRDDFEDIHNREFSPLLKLQNLPNFRDYLYGGEFYIFCFVRNPYTRLLSCYLNKIKNPADQETCYKSIVLESMGLDKKDMSISITFEDFIGVIEGQDPLGMDYHWRPQAYLTCQNTIKYNYIGRLETFSDDFFQIGGHLSEDFHKYYGVEIRHETNATTLLEEYYDDDLQSRVYEKYKIDFLRFSYEYSLS